MNSIYTGCPFLKMSYGKETLYYCKRNPENLYHSSCEGCKFNEPLIKNRTQSKYIVKNMRSRPMRP